jgi:hypothetical protein
MHLSNARSELGNARFPLSPLGVCGSSVLLSLGRACAWRLTGLLAFAFLPPARQKRTVPERPGDPPPRAHVLADRERADAAQLREIAQKAPPLPAVRPSFPSEPPWSAGLAELSGLWLSVSCECTSHTGLPFRYLAAAHGWKTP